MYQTMFDWASEHKNGKYRRILQILKEKLPLLYVKFGEDILDYSVEFKRYKKEVENVRWYMYIIENEEYFFERYPYIIDDILEHVRGGMLDISGIRIDYDDDVRYVRILLDELKIDRFNTILDIGTGDGLFPALSIISDTTKYAIGVDNDVPHDFCGAPQHFGEVMSRVDYRVEDGLKTKYDLPENSLVTCFYISSGGNFLHIVDTAVCNNACIIVQNGYLCSLIEYARDNNMHIIEEYIKPSRNSVLIAIPENW